MRYRFACKQIQAGAGIFSIVRTIILTFLNLFELVFFIQGFMVTLYIHIIHNNNNNNNNNNNDNDNYII